MKNSILISFLALFITVTTFAHHDPDHKTVYSVDTDKSSVTWIGKKVTGQHTGNISIKSGTILVDHGTLHSVNLAIDMSSITCTDIEDETYNENLVGHLASDDFFSVATHPEAQFTTTSIKADGSVYMVTGKLTIKGITHEISFPVQIEETNGLFNAKGTATFDRTKWNIQYGSGKFFESLGDKMIYDDVTLAFSLVASVVKK